MFDTQHSKRPEADRTRAMSVQKPGDSKRSMQLKGYPTRLPLYTQAWGNQLPPRLRLPVTRQVAQAKESSPQEPPAPIQRKENATGLPDTLKAGVENLSGLSMDDVKVHYNSSEPAQVQALAYTRGADIHVGPGQEKHLPHEAWHVVQQKQGHVQPTVQTKGVTINDDLGLEKEADVMGEQANRESDAGASISAQRWGAGIGHVSALKSVQMSTAPVQRFFTHVGQKIEDIDKIEVFLADVERETWQNNKNDFDLKKREREQGYDLNAWLRDHGYNYSAAGILQHLDAQRPWDDRKTVINQVTAGQWLVTIEVGSEMPSPQVKKDLLEYIMSIPIDKGWKFFQAYFSNVDSREKIWRVLIGDNWKEAYQTFEKQGNMLGQLMQAVTNFAADRTLPGPAERENLLRYMGKLQDQEEGKFRAFQDSQRPYISIQFYYFFLEADRALDVGNIVRILIAFSQDDKRPRQEIIDGVRERIVALGADQVLDHIQKIGDFPILSKVLEEIFPRQLAFWGEHEKSRIKYDNMNLVIQAVRDFRDGKGLGDQERVRKAYRECKQGERENIASVFLYDNYWTMYSIIVFRDITEVAGEADLLVTLLQAIFRSRVSREIRDYALKALSIVTPMVFKRVLEETQTRGRDLRALFDVQVEYLNQRVLQMLVEVSVPAVGFSGVNKGKAEDHYERANSILNKQYNIGIAMPSYTQIPVGKEEELLGKTKGAISASAMKAQDAFILGIIDAYRTHGKITSFWFSSIIQDRTGKDAKTALLGQAFSENAAPRFKGHEAVFIDITAPYFTLAHELGHILAGTSEHHEHVKGARGEEETGDPKNLMFFMMKGGPVLTPEQLQAFKGSLFAILQKK